MGKYDCTKARDFLHEIARAKQCCKQTLTSDSCGDCPLAIRHFKGYDRFCLNRRDITDNSFMEIPEKNFSEMVERLQKWSDSHPERRELTGKETTVLTGLRLLGYNFLAADANGMTYVYGLRPTKGSSGLYWTVPDHQIDPICISKSGMFDGVADFSDEKPLVIDEILNERN